MKSTREQKSRDSNGSKSAAVTLSALENEWHVLRQQVSQEVVDAPLVLCEDAHLISITPWLVNSSQPIVADKSEVRESADDGDESVSSRVEVLVEKHIRRIHKCPLASFKLFSNTLTKLFPPPHQSNLQHKETEKGNGKEEWSMGTEDKKPPNQIQFLNTIVDNQPPLTSTLNTNEKNHLPASDDGPIPILDIFSSFPLQTNISLTLHSHLKAKQWEAVQNLHVPSSAPLPALVERLWCNRGHISGAGREKPFHFLRIENTQYTTKLPSDLEMKVDEDHPKHILMDSVSVKEIPLRVATPYLYGHSYNHNGSDQRMCYHYLTIDKITQSAQTSSNRPTPPPIIVELWRQRKRKRKCFVCEDTPATLAVYGHTQSKSNPCLYCDVCFRLMFGDVHGTNDGDGVIASDDFGQTEQKSSIEIIPYYHDD